MKTFILFIFIICISYLSSCKKDTPFEEKTGEIIDNNHAVIDKDTEWKDLFGGDTIDYYVYVLVRVKGTAKLTIKPGVHVSFETPQSGIRVEDNAALNAVGTLAKGILLDSRQSSEPGTWKGVIFASANSANVLDYVEVSGAGSSIDEGYCDAKTAVGLAKIVGTMATIRNCLIKNSGGNGLWVAGTENISLNFRYNNVGGEDAPVACTARDMGKIDSTSYFFSNNCPYIDVYETLGAEISNDDTLKHTFVPFRISGRVHVLKTLTILKGCILEFNTGGELTTTGYGNISEHTGVIKAIGSSGTKIIFRGVNQQPGSWVGITLTSKGANELYNCIISDAGAGNAYMNASSVKGNVIVGREGMGGNATIKYCTISNSAGFGIAKFTDNNTPANSSTVITMSLINMIFTQTNSFSNNSLGSIGNYY